MKPTRVALFSSGRGSNFESIFAEKANLNIEITGLICDKKEALVLEKARKLGVPILLTPKPNLQIEEVLFFLKETQTEWVILAGYMRLISEKVIEAMRSPRGHSRVINIHPSLLPAFPGLAGYQQAFNYGCKIAGVTIHLVEKELDQGPILAQECFDISSIQSPSEIEARGLAIEHRLYPKTLNWVLKENFTLEVLGGRSCVRSL
jgi:phosphoribosylglycinamide formyltransferase-1